MCTVEAMLTDYLISAMLGEGHVLLWEGYAHQAKVHANCFVASPSGDCASHTECYYNC